ncbi:hypothetical protein M0R72_12645 [Candidatus Pacearchaeota archaeon]|jgi:tRNA(Ile2) C34 agmatinyltransferase TiaS|nr:hypothetical protein [Candidatus Pacearchaeota archaeon]
MNPVCRNCGTSKHVKLDGIHVYRCDLCHFRFTCIPGTKRFAEWKKQGNTK